MSQLVAMLFAAVVFLTAVATQAATLRSETVIDGDHVTLGDLFDGLRDGQADVAVAMAPDPGREVVLPAAWLVRVARAYGIDYRPAVANETIVLSRASTVVDFAGVEPQLVEALRPHLGAGEIQLELSGLDRVIHLPAHVDASVSLVDVSYTASSGQFTALFAAPADAPVDEQVRVPVRGHARAILMVPVLTGRLDSGDIIGISDLDWIAVESQRIGPDVILDEDEMVGLAVRRTLSPGQPLRAADLRAPVIVPRGDTVTIHYHVGTLAITARGRALQDGAAGDVVRVINTDSNRTIEVVVRGPNEVAVLNVDPIVVN